MNRLGRISYRWRFGVLLFALLQIPISNAQDPETEFQIYTKYGEPLPGTVTATNWLDVIILADVDEIHPRVYYTLDGTVPTTNSTSYFGFNVLRITNSLTLTATAYSKDFANSKTRSVAIEIVQGNRDAVVFYFQQLVGQVPVMTVVSNRVESLDPVSLAVDSKFFPQMVYYTLDGTAPTTNSTYAGSNWALLRTTSNALMRVVAYDEYFSQSITGQISVEIGLSPGAEDPVTRVFFLEKYRVSREWGETWTGLPERVSATNWLDVRIQNEYGSDAFGSEAQTFYTLDGTVPTPNSARFRAGDLLRITNSLTLTATGYSADLSLSQTKRLIVEIVEGDQNRVVFSLSGSQQNLPVTIEVKDRVQALDSAGIVMDSKFFPQKVFYTLDGSAPTTNSAPLSDWAFVHIPESAVLRAIAYNAELTESVTGQLNVEVVPSYTIYFGNARLPDPSLVMMEPEAQKYRSNSVVTVTATNKNGWTFRGWAISPWEDSIYSTNRSLTLVITNSIGLVPVFTTRVAASVIGGGRIVVTPEEAQLWDWVSVQALADHGHYFDRWSGTLSGNTNYIGFRLTNATPALTATFLPLGAGEVSLTVPSPASGRILVNPMKSVYSIGDLVELEVDLRPSSPSPVPTSFQSGPQRFVGWSGDASGVENPLSVTMDRSKVIEAIVEPAYPMEQHGEWGWGATPAFAADGTVYVASDARLYALTPDLKLKWTVTNLNLAGDAVIGPSGNIFVVAENGNATCVSPAGQELWRYVSDDPYTYPPGFTPVRTWPLTPVITSDETLYYLSGKSPLRGGLAQLYIVKDGKLVQRIDNPPSALLAGPDDTFYVGTAAGFEAHKPFGTVKWSSQYPLPVVIDRNGRLYSVRAGTSIVALDFQGQHLWTRQVSDWAGRLQMGGGGRLFVRRNSGISVLDTNGVLLWERRRSTDVLPLEDGGALVLEWKSEPTFDIVTQRPGSYNWAIFRRILPDGRSGEFSSYYTGLSTRNGGVGYELRSITDAGDVYGYWVERGGGPFGWVRYSLFRWKSGFGPQSERQIELARSGNGWLLRKRGVPGRAAVESSTNLRDWEAAGEMDTELSITPAAGSPRFYRLRME